MKMLTLVLMVLAGNTVWASDPKFKVGDCLYFEPNSGENYDYVKIVGMSENHYIYRQFTHAAIYKVGEEWSGLNQAPFARYDNSYHQILCEVVGHMSEVMPAYEDTMPVTKK